MIKKLFIYVSAVILLTGCTSAPKNNKEYVSVDEEKILYLIKSIEKSNASVPNSFYVEYDIEGSSSGRSFKAGGYARIIDSPRKMRIVFQDAVFKSPITEIIQDEDIIKLYFPLDKIIYVDNTKKLNIKDYSNLDIDYSLASDLISGRIPLLRNYSIKKGLKSEDGADNRMVILENNEFYETISFIKEIPDKILWYNKKTGNKIEVYLKEPLKKDDIVFYKLIRLVSLSSDLNISVHFKTVRFNIPVDAADIVKIKLPAGGKIINRN